MNYVVYFNCRKLDSNDIDAIAEYAKRLSAYCRTNWHCKPSKSVTGLCSSQRASAHTLWIQIQTGASTPSSEELAGYISQISIQGISTVCFLIGYEWQAGLPDAGAAPPPVLSLSAMDISPGLTGVILYEQLYRSYRIIHHQPYHK